MTIIIKYGNRLIIDNQRDQRNADISPNIPHTIDTIINGIKNNNQNPLTPLAELKEFSFATQKTYINITVIINDTIANITNITESSLAIKNIIEDNSDKLPNFTTCLLL